eukprot:12925124-Prorocentrum_lima.AAC.1
MRRTHSLPNQFQHAPVRRPRTSSLEGPRSKGQAHHKAMPLHHHRPAATSMAVENHTRKKQEEQPIWP